MSTTQTSRGADRLRADDPKTEAPPAAGLKAVGGVAGWLDAQLNWPKPLTRGRRERL